MKNTWVPIPAVPAVLAFVTQLRTPYLSELFSGGDFAWPPFGWSVQVTETPCWTCKVSKNQSFRNCSFHQTVPPTPFLFGPSKSWWFWSPIPNHLRGGRELLANIHHHHHHHLGVLDTKFQIQMPFLAFWLVWFPSERYATVKLEKIYQFFFFVKIPKNPKKSLKFHYT